MKNFFKKLAFVLALAMVVTAIAPAAKASAASSPTLKIEGKKLYLGGDVTGNYGETYRFTFNNAKGYTAKWKSSNAKVATVDAKTGNIQAIAVGKATITATLTKKGSKTVELKATVWVKQNAEKVGFGSLKAVKEMAVGDTAKVNVYRQVGDTKVWKQTDKAVSTDVVKWTSSNPEVATVDKWGKVKAESAGEATITATATQSEGSKAGATASFKVTVKAGLVDAKQSGLDTIKATFAGDLSAVVNKDNVKVLKVDGSAKVNVIVKDVTFDDTDKTKATITTFTQFDKDVEYIVEYAETTVKFKGADKSAEAVASIAIKTTEVEPNDTKKIEFYVYDKDGVDITSDELVGRIKVSNAATNNDSYLDEANGTITFWAKDKSATIKASFDTYTYKEDFTPKTIDATGVIVSKEKVINVSSVGTATIAKDKPDFSKATLNMSVKDTDKKLFLKTTNSDNKEVTSYGDDASKFKFTSTNDTVLVVYDDGSLYPVKEGAAAVIVKYNDAYLGTVTVTIGGERKASVITPKFDRTTLSAKTATNDPADSIKLTIEVQDQYKDAFSYRPTIEFLTGPIAKDNAPVPTVDPVDGSVGKYEVVFGSADFDTTTLNTKGTYTYRVTVDKQSRTVSFTVGEADKAVNYAFTNAGTTVDTAFNYHVNDDTKTDKKTFDMQLASYAGNGYKFSNIAVAATRGAAVVSAAALNVGGATTGSAMYIEVTDKDGNQLDSKFASIDASGKVTVNPVAVSGTVDGANKLIKLDKGIYTVKAYVVKADDKPVVKAVAQFVVNDTQTAVTVKDLKATTNLSLGSYANIFALSSNEAYGKFTIGENKVYPTITKAIGSTDATVNTAKTIYIQKVSVEVPVSTTIGATGVTGVFVQEFDLNFRAYFK